MLAYLNFPLILLAAVFATGLIYLVDLICWAPGRRRAAAHAGSGIGVKMPILVEYGRSFFWVLLIVLIIRSFIIQPFKVPTGSLEPTILPGDFIAVNMFAYGLRFPVSHTKLLNIGEPERGDIVVFRWPVDPSIDYVKRVVGVPGDQVVYKNKVLTVNGQVATQTRLGPTLDLEASQYGGDSPAIKVEEDLTGVKHDILLRPNQPARDFNLVIPPGEYLMMGDNRDNSDDSRAWGLVPEKAIVGKAMIIWFSWNSAQGGVQWNRIFKRL
jgi:signal peptidase I